MLPKPADLRSATFHVSQQPPGWVVQGYGEESFAGENVTVEGALGVTAVMSGFTILMEDTSSLPLITYRRLERGKERAYNSPLYALLHDQPNPEHTSLVYREIVMGHLLGWGNHYSQKIWDKRGVLRELWPLRPDRMRVLRENGERRYLYTQTNGTPRAFRQEEIWHIPAFGFDGLMGYSRITLARNAIGLAMATEKYGSKTFSNGARPDIVLKSPKPYMDDDAYKRLKENWQQVYGGSDNARKVAILEDGLDFGTVGFPPDDAQFLETRKFQVDEIARIFRIPPHMLSSTEKSTSWGTGIEQQELGYLSHTLRPWLKRIEQQGHKDLLLEAEKRELLIEHLVEDFLRTDIQARMTAYVQAITNGIFSRNEVRELENKNPIRGLDRMLVPLNMTTVDEADTQKPAKPSRASSALDGHSLRSARGFDVRPFVLDIARRIVRREVNELIDASKRWLEKGKPEKFEAWLEQFYKRDHLEFVERALEPISQQLDARQLATVISAYLDEHGATVQRIYRESDHLDVTMEAWQEVLPDQLTDAILGKEILDDEE